MSQIVQFRRPDAPEGSSSIFLDCRGSPEVHVKRMESLGYVVINKPPGLSPLRSEQTP